MKKLNVTVSSNNNNNNNDNNNNNNSSSNNNKMINFDDVTVENIKDQNSN